MGKQFIISVGREYGSGGHEIGRKLANAFGIHLYDRSLLDEFAAMLLRTFVFHVQCG